eukprot:9012856-Lingulodinium_polyedra.AAC.1
MASPPKPVGPNARSIWVDCLAVLKRAQACPRATRDAHTHTVLCSPDLGASPSTMLAGKLVDFFGCLPGH